MARARVITLVVCLMTALSTALWAGAQAQGTITDKYFGTWLREERDRTVQIGPCSGELGPICGRIVQLMDPATGRPLADQGALGKAGKPLVGAAVLLSCKIAGSDVQCAKTYIPANDQTISNISLSIQKDGRLKVGRFPKYVYWTRVN